MMAQSRELPRIPVFRLELDRRYGRHDGALLLSDDEDIFVVATGGGGSDNIDYFDLHTGSHTLHFRARCKRFGVKPNVEKTFTIVAFGTVNRDGKPSDLFESDTHRRYLAEVAVAALSAYGGSYFDPFRADRPAKVDFNPELKEIIFGAMQ
jgi:hypothetical protein